MGNPVPAEGATEPMVSRPYRVLDVKVETADVTTFVVTPVAGAPVVNARVVSARAGQFNMLWMFGVGEVPISCSAVRAGGVLVHTVRSVGAVTRALAHLAVGDVVGVRGPFGTGWDVASAAGRDVVVVGGGIGFAPLRPVVDELLANRAAYGRVSVLIGARTPDEIVFSEDLADWRGRVPDVDVEVTVDAAGPGWKGHVGVVTGLIARARYDPSRTVAFVCGPEAMMRFATAALQERGVPLDRIRLSAERNMQCAIAQCGHCLLGEVFVCRDGPVLDAARLASTAAGAGPMSGSSFPRKPSLAVWKFASCDGCQLTLLDCEDELLALAGEVELSYFLEAGRAIAAGPYDLSLVEGSITTEVDAARIREVRAASKRLVTIGACATAGGIQALRNFADVEEFLAIVYAQPQFISTLADSTAIAAHVAVDFELRGCPITKAQLLEVISAFLHERRPSVSPHSVCVECKTAGNVCVTVAHGTPCLGPVTQAGCGALCPSYNRGCYGCFGPMETPNLPSMVQSLRDRGVADGGIVRMLRTFNAGAPPFREAGDALEAESNEWRQ